MREHNPYPKNAPGPFYVGDGECITCGAPEAAAPDLIEFDETPHCYFRRQPETVLELEDAIEAIRVSCCGGVHYGGSDPVILTRIAETEVARRARLRRLYGGDVQPPDLEPDA